ncbi:hexose kinase [Kitasatospora terrestris]|uniref:1-phosphofructokinase family hexose kinase n=1 Tax=Kitasatospora terrestris TaxID=258051 RepID=A0ABP9DGD3_9ACTN
MILTVTPNAALDVTYRVARLEQGGSTRVTAVDERAGGEGVNVSRVLQGLGVDTAVSGFAGGATGRAVRTDLIVADLPDAMVGIRAETRRTVAVVDEGAGTTSVLLEPGPEVSATEWAELVVRFTGLVRSAKAVVLSGSLPPGLPVDAYATLVRIGRAHDRPVVLDTDGEPLLAALSERPTLVKPDAGELLAATGETDPRAAISALRAAGAQSVVASMGEGGLIAVAPGEAWQAGPPSRVAGRATGAGDAAVAALAAGLAVGTPWPRMVRRAVALSAASAAVPLAGSFDAELYGRLCRRVVPRPFAT